ncbi:glycoside hydrolase family 61 protein [Rutstroemia sp. NJR-2017a BBW]|nr:glycoside hydrolase family 61 protein [Rutstroemia sp. NJR-2017a BBW]
MKTVNSLVAALAALTNVASGHYIFQSFTHNKIQYPTYGYIRKNTNYNSPVTDLTSNDLRCNVGGESGAGTQTITVKAGDSFSFTADVAVYHQGATSIYMAKAPSTAAAFDGSGKVWFKILDIGPTFSGGQASWDLWQTYTYTIPPNVPSGDYLLRIQQLAIHNPYPGGTPQWYIECAQITVTNGGSGTPGPLVSIPGAFSATDPGYTANIYSNFNNYTVPGPAVWSGQGGSGAFSGAAAGNPSATTTLAALPAGGTTPASGGGSTSSAAGGSTSASATKPGTTTLATSTVAPVPTSTGAAVAKYGQCGGTGWTGGTTCVSGISVCK